MRVYEYVDNRGDGVYTSWYQRRQVREQAAQQSLVAYYLQNQAKPISAEEKVYFGFTESSIGQVACV